MMKKGYLLLEDGTIFEGTLFGAAGNPVGEVVFNTGMTGYQETLTDPSYYGQIVVMTYPLIGNYGFNDYDGQSKAPMVKGFIIREGCDSFSNWRGSESLEDYFFRQGLTGLMDVDTRALTRHLRTKGTLRGKIMPDLVSDQEFRATLKQNAMEEITCFSNRDAVLNVTTTASYRINPHLYNVAVLDFGIKKHILESMTERNMILNVFPATTTAEKLLAEKPDGLFLSNGPGDPNELGKIVEQVRLMLGEIPIFGICLGHQILAHALGGKTRKMKFGHRGSNHPVKDLENNRVRITSQNHGYEVVEESLDKDKILVTHINVNDGTVEGIRHAVLPLFSVQYHPEASPGPGDSAYLFDRFNLMMKDFKEKK
jgi:carbamoyl-phosphate synthase small subunit